MRLQRVGLREAHVAVVTLVRLLARVRAQVTLQLERVRRRVRAMRALLKWVNYVIHKVLMCVKSDL